MTKVKQIANKAFDLLIMVYGILLCSNIFFFYRSASGNTYLNYSQLLGVIILIVEIIKKRHRLLQTALEVLRFVGIPCLIFIGLIFVSFINGFFYVNDAITYDLVFKAVIYFFWNAVIQIIVIVLIRKNLEPLFRGFLIGLIANFFASLIAFLAFRLMGVSLTLKYLTFVGRNMESGYYIPSYNFRAQGLFLEPSHMTACLCVLMPMLMFHFKTNGCESLFGYWDSSFSSCHNLGASLFLSLAL